MDLPPRTNELTLDGTAGPEGSPEAVTRTIGTGPRVDLRDTDPISGATIEPPKQPEAYPPLGDAGRYRLFGEIARGGMGAVLRGRDPDLGRDLAVKVVLERHKDDPEILRRFLEEAQIGGQLQHPGIVPVYDLGRFADDRPFFAMKLVRGRTLSALLAERASRQADLSRFLTIFESICQTVAYAHARGVIHRDLKPSNIMVGAFGEVQVMDWGLAKVLGPKPEAEPSSRAVPPPTSAIRTARSGSDVDGSRSGSILGTPAYMAPEQAAGQVESVDERSDVFGLGSILGEVLTGAPAYVGRNGEEVYRKAARGDTADALARLDASGADGELIALAKDCLLVEPLDRPRNAKAVADRLTGYLAGVQDRLRRAEIAEVEARGEAERERQARVLTEATAVQERRARRLTLALAATAVLAAAAGGGTWWWVDRQTRDRRALAAVATSDARLLLDRALKAPAGELAPWREAAEASKRASDLLPGGNAEARKTIDDLAAQVARGEDDARFLQEIADIRSAKEDDPDGTDTNTHYAEAFASRKIDLDKLPPARAAELLRSRPPAVVVELAAALDDWADARRKHRGAPLDWRRLIEAARLADPEPYRDRLRASLVESDPAARREAVRKLAADPKAADQPVASVVLLARALDDALDSPGAIALLREAQGRHPLDVWVNRDLGAYLRQGGNSEAAIPFLAVARAMRPETAHDLAHALEMRGRGEEAIAVFRDLVRLRPENGLHHICLANALQHDPKLRAEAEAAYREAASAARATLKRRPNDPTAHKALGTALAHSHQVEQGIAELTEAIRLEPEGVAPYVNLAGVLTGAGKKDEAIATARTAVGLRPDLFRPHGVLANALLDAGRVDEAIGEFRAAIQAGAEYAPIYFILGRTLAIAKSDFEGAVTPLREACRLWPREAEFRAFLAAALYETGRYAEALVEAKHAGDLVSRGANSGIAPAPLIRACEQSLALEGRIEAVVKGQDRPKDLPERMAMALMCYRKALYATSLRLYEEALAERPGLADDATSGLPYNAACDAALIAAGKAKDAPPPDDATRAGLREKALDWLAADLAAWSGRWDDNAKDVPILVRTVAHWKDDADIAILRDPAELAKLPEAERAACRKLWADVDALLARASKAP